MGSQPFAMWRHREITGPIIGAAPKDSQSATAAVMRLTIEASSDAQRSELRQELLMFCDFAEQFQDTARPVSA